MVCYENLLSLAFSINLNGSLHRTLECLLGKHWSGNDLIWAKPGGSFEMWTSPRIRTIIFKLLVRARHPGMVPVTHHVFKYRGEHEEPCGR